MPLKNRPLGEAELALYEAKRDFAAELLEAVREMKAGQVQVVLFPRVAAIASTNPKSVLAVAGK